MIWNCSRYHLEFCGFKHKENWKLAEGDKIRYNQLLHELNLALFWLQHGKSWLNNRLRCNLEVEMGVLNFFYTRQWKLQQLIEFSSIILLQVNEVLTSTKKHILFQFFHFSFYTIKCFFSPNIIGSDCQLLLTTLFFIMQRFYSAWRIFISISYIVIILYYFIHDWFSVYQLL